MVSIENHTNLPEVVIFNDFAIDRPSLICISGIVFLNSVTGSEVLNFLDQSFLQMSIYFHIVWHAILKETKDFRKKELRLLISSMPSYKRVVLVTNAGDQNTLVTPRNDY